MRTPALALALLVPLAFAPPSRAAETPKPAPALAATPADEGLARLLRQPDIEGDTIAFVYAGDLWTVPAEGGLARRLTSDDGLELFPKLSPDGRQIAFTADYSGTRQVHVISVDGGAPRQLTWYNDVGAMPPRGGIDNRVLDWTPDGREILFLPHRLGWTDRMGAPYLVPAAGGMEHAMEIQEAGGGMFSPDGTKLVYTPIEREFRTWKRYHGGRAQDVWIYDFVKHASTRLTDYDGTDNQPLWVGDTIYFTSDRNGGILNLFALDPATKQTRQVTFHTDYDVLWPSAGKSAIVYECGGYIWKLDPATGKDTRVPIRLMGDFRGTLPRIQNVTANIVTAGLSPTGARALLDARGDVFTVPAKEGSIRNLTATPGIREIDPTWSPDGRTVAYQSDRTGEYEIYVRNADGSGDERQVTKGSRGWRSAPAWSPDGKRFAFADRTARLWIADAATGAATEVDRGKYEDLTTYTWSPDSRWLAYVKSGDTQLTSLWAYSLPERKTYQLTSGTAQDFEPTFDPRGRYLYFLSNRDFNLTFSGYEFEFVYTQPTRVYVAVLAKDGPALFLPKSDEEPAAAAPAGDAGTSKARGAAAPGKGEGSGSAKPAAASGGDQAADAKPGGAGPAAPPTVRIDVDGFEARVRAIPGEPGDYRSLRATDKGVLYLTGTGGDTTLHLFDVDAKEDKTVLSGINGYDLSADGRKILWRKGGGARASFGIVDAVPDQKTDKALDLAQLETRIDPRAEWAEEFVDAWRTFRDWFYDPAMHGMDWEAVRRKYEVLVPHLAHRSDLDYIFGEMVGEVSSSHTYVESSDDWQKERSENGLLGAEIVADPSGYFRIARIFPGENWHQDFRSPLTEPGVRAKAGDLVLAVDGVPTRGVDNFYRLLEGKPNVVVTLRLASSAAGSDAHDERVRTITSETNLRYLDWVLQRRAMVDRLSGGRIGYIHLPNTATEGARELYKAFYPQSHKQALVIDDRYNGGGFIPFYMIDLLGRPLLSYWARRDLAPFTTPGFYHRGPKAVLVNGYSSSGGDAFPYYFREQKLGRIYGTRTWGGLIGINFNPDLMDGGTLYVPTFRFIDPQSGAWAVEGHGVDPDVEVQDLPELVAKGQDPTLERAVADLLEELKTDPPKPLTVPPPPNLRPAPMTVPSGR